MIEHQWKKIGSAQPTATVFTDRQNGALHEESAPSEEVACDPLLEAREAGFAEGQASAKAELKPRLDALGRAAAELSRAESEVRRAATTEALALVQMLFSRVLGAELAANSEFFELLLTKLLQDFEGHSEIALHVSEADFLALSGSDGLPEHVSLNQDPGLSVGVMRAVAGREVLQIDMPNNLDALLAQTMEELEKNQGDPSILEESTLPNAAEDLDE